MGGGGDGRVAGDRGKGWAELRPLHLKLLLSCTLPKTNSSPLKNGRWETTFRLGFGRFSGANSWFQGG